MRLRDWNLRQRIVVVIGLGLALVFLGRWITTRHRFTGWVAYAPLSRGVHTVGGTALHPGLRLLIWVALTLIWVVVSLALLRSTPDSENG